MPTFLTVKQAAKAIGRSTSSIRRAIYPITKNDKHPDRSHVEPSVEEVLKLRVAGVNFAWHVSEEFLARVLPVTVPAEKGSGPAKATAQPQGELLAMLQRELEIKNQQITKQMELMNALSERLREGNILMGSLQQRLGLGDGRDNPTGDPVRPPRSAPPTSAKVSTPKRTGTPTEKPKPAPAAVKPKPTFLQKLFGRK